MAIFNVQDYGAVGDGSNDDRAAIQAAADAAFAAGGGTVYLPEGTYAIGNGDVKPSEAGIQLRSNVSLVGDGMGVSRIKVKNGESPIAGQTSLMTGIVRTPFDEETRNVTISNLTLDGNSANVTGKVDGFFTGTRPGSTATVEDITLDAVEIKNASGYGFDPHERTTRLTITNSVAHHNGLDGFTLDYVIDSTVSNNRAYANGRHGFNIVTTSHGLVLEGNESSDNGSTGIIVQRGGEDIPSPYDITLRDNTVFGNAREGILVRYSHDVLVTENRVYENGRHGINILGSTDVRVEGNAFSNNSQGGNGDYDEIHLDADPDQITGTVFPIARNSVIDNTITVGGAVRASFAIWQNRSATNSRFEGNSITGTPVDGVTLTPPQLTAPLGDTSVTAGNAFVYGVPAASFVDIDTGDVLSFRAQRADGSALPAWLVFNAATRRFSGTPGAGDAGILDVRVTATDPGGRFQGDIFRIAIETANEITGTTGPDSLKGTAGADTIDGLAGADTLNGLAGNDLLNGGDGDDHLTGGAGADSMAGGAGNDRYYVDSIGDKAIEGAGSSGTDTVYATVDFTLGADVEKIALLGFGDIAATGNSARNTLLGNSGANLLDGGAGDDVLIGGAGVDRLTGGEGADSFEYRTLADSLGDPAGRDVIEDFRRSQNDRIDLGDLDANSTAAGNQAFAFIGEAGFGGVAGELRMAIGDGFVLMLGDVDGDRAADFTIRVQSGALLASDFVL